MAKKSNRVKSDNKLIAVTGWRHADELLRQMAKAQLTIQAAESEATETVNEARACLAIAAKPHHEQIKTLTLSLEAFAAHHRADFGDKKSRDLTFGVLGWRLSTSIRVKKDATLELLKQVFKRKAKPFIHVKETPDKEAMAKLTDEQLAAVKARRVVKDDFFVEPKLPEAVDYPENK
jgi:phage host-nuclease inhibitor protein Gam